VGNLRTALLAWLFARHSGRGFVVRMEDLDQERTVVGSAEQQLADLATLGLEWDTPVLFQSSRLEVYQTYLLELEQRGLSYPCFCTRREIREAASAPHHAVLPDGAYPGTCRNLTPEQRSAKVRSGRPPAQRIRGERTVVTFVDQLCGQVTATVDDFVLRRNDGAPAYNLAVVVDDAAQQVDQVVRGDDLLTSTPRQLYLAQLLGLPAPQYVHVPLALNGAGQRLAKRDGAVTLAALRDQGWSSSAVLARIGASLGLCPAEKTEVTAAELLAGFDPQAVPRSPWVVT
jgi:glutamyl-tRNA synthetase